MWFQCGEGVVLGHNRDTMTVGTYDDSTNFNPSILLEINNI